MTDMVLKRTGLTQVEDLIGWIYRLLAPNLPLFDDDCAIHIVDVVGWVEQ
jgi:hypothetical protein